MIHGINNRQAWQKKRDFRSKYCGRYGSRKTKSHKEMGMGSYYVRHPPRVDFGMHYFQPLVIPYTSKVVAMVLYK